MPPRKRGPKGGIDEVQVDHGAAGDEEVKARQCCRFWGQRWRGKIVVAEF
jgi:hypothetical protein